MKALKIINGSIYGRLKIIREIPPHIYPSGRKRRKVECLCSCGTVINVVLMSLRSKNTKSCGCHRSEKTKKKMYKHGMSHTRLHDIWLHMRQRCVNKNDASFKNYGGRGIQVCKSWNDFSKFKKDMYDSYKNHLRVHGVVDTTIDRINNDGNYTRKNCRWATKKEQANNTRRNIAK